MKISVLAILIVCLSLHTLTVFGHPKPEGMSDAEHKQHHINEEVQEQLKEGEKERKALKEKLRSTNNRVAYLEGKDKGRDKVNAEGKRISTAKKAGKAASGVVEVYELVLDIFSTRCAGYCAQRGIEPEYHFRRCKGGHEYWICKLPNMAWLHRACCPEGYTYRQDASGVYRCMPNNTGSGSGSGSGSRTNQHSNDPQDQ